MNDDKKSTLLEYVRCPNCSQELSSSSITNQLACGNCGRVYPLENRILRLGGGENHKYLSAVDNLTRTDLAGITKLIQEEKNLRLVERNLISEFPMLARYLLAEGRADWRFLIDLAPSSRILDCGCGWGNLAFELAQEHGVVAALDSSPAKLEFLAARAQSADLQNIDLIQADFGSGLPIEDSSFDLVVLNGVLEWAGEYRTDIHPREAQRSLLLEAHRVLTANGHLYLGIENRIGFEYFRGRPDDHTGLRFTNLLPRVLANAYMKIRTGRHYRTLTYSRRGISKLLEGSGFPEIHLYYPYHDYKQFDHLVPITPSALSFFNSTLRHRRRSTLFLLAFFAKSLITGKFKAVGSSFRQVFANMARLSPQLFSNVTPGFSIIASKLGRKIDQKTRS